MSPVTFFASVRFEPTLFFVIGALGLHYNAIGCEFLRRSEPLVFYRRAHPIGNLGRSRVTVERHGNIHLWVGRDPHGEAPPAGRAAALLAPDMPAEPMTPNRPERVAQCRLVFKDLPER